MSNEQLLGMTEQLILLSAFFGGFSATFLAAILAVDPASSKKIANWTIIISALAACCFVVSAVSSISIVNGIRYNPDNATNAFEALKALWLTTGISMLLGVFSLLSSIGLSGWLRSKPVGIATTSIAAIAIVIVGAFA